MLDRRKFLGFAPVLAAGAMAGRLGRAACPQAADGDESRRVEDNAPYQGGESRRVPELRIVHLTDPQFGFGAKFKSHAENYAEDLKRFEKALELAAKLKPDLIAVTGDMVNRAEDMEKDWPRLLGEIPGPVVFTPGNHDVGTAMTRKDRDRYLKVFGYDRKTVNVKGWRIIAGNTQFLWNTELAAEQREYERWAAAELKRAAKECGGRVIVAGHYPPYTWKTTEKDNYENFPSKLRMKRLEAYRAAGVKYFLAGHTHGFAVRGWKDLAILNPETTSRDFDERPLGFRLLEIFSPALDDFIYSFKSV